MGFSIPSVFCLCRIDYTVRWWYKFTRKISHGASKMLTHSSNKVYSLLCMSLTYFNNWFCCLNCQLGR